MQIDAEAVEAERRWIADRADVVVPLVNRVRGDLGEQFETEVATVDTGAYLDAVEAVFDEGDLAVNVAALVRLLRDLDVTDDHPGFVVDELLGRELAGMLAGNQPLRLLGEATFHYADLMMEGDRAHDQSDSAGMDDLDAALAAGFQTRLPGWSWREGPSPFDRD